MKRLTYQPIVIKCQIWYLLYFMVNLPQSIAFTEFSIENNIASEITQMLNFGIGISDEARNFRQGANNYVKTFKLLG